MSAPTRNALGVRLTRRQLVALALALAFALVPPVLGRADILSESRASTVAGAAIFAAMAISLNLLMGYCGQISLGHGALLAVGAYTAGLIAGRYYLPAALGIAAAMAMGAAVAFLIGLPALRLRGLYLAIVTVGFAVMMENSILQIPWLSRGSAGVEIPRPYFGGFGLLREYDFLALVLVLVLAVWLMDANVARTKLGRAFLGIREDEQVAQSFGVDVARYKLLAFTLSGALAGLAGALYGHLALFVDSRTFSFERFSLLLVVLVVLGGLGNRVGVVVAAASFTIIPDLLEFFERWELIIGAALLVFTIARHSEGLGAAFREAREAGAARDARRMAMAGDDGVDDDDKSEVPPLPDMPRPASVPPRPALPDGAPILEVTDVRVAFGGLAAVDGASLAVPEGKIVGLIGPNGAGKTTLFNAISGFVAPSSGAISFLGRRIDRLAPHERARLGMGRTFQHVGLAHNLSAHENLLLAQHLLADYGAIGSLGYLGRIGEVEDGLAERAGEAMEALGLSSHLDVPVKNLSGGQKRIVEIAAALVTAPEMLMLDEPSAGMAPAMVESLAVRLRDLRDELGRTVLLIEHHVPLVFDVCDEVYVMSSGHVIAHGTPADVASQPEVVEAYLGDAHFLASAPAARKQRRSAPARSGRPAAARSRR